MEPGVMELKLKAMKAKIALMEAEAARQPTEFAVCLWP
jgi:hypothetical protein